MTAAILTQAVRRRRTGLAGWSLGLIGMCGLLAVAYPTVRDNHELDKTFGNLPAGVKTILGLHGAAGLTSPAGYLNSQYFANILPVMFLVFGLGVAAWAVSGDEAAGTLELLLANPVSRARVAAERAGALLAMLAGLTAVAAAALAAMAPAVRLDKGLSPTRIAAATAGCALLAGCFAALTFAVGAATGNRSAALAAGTGTAAAGYLVEGLAAQVHPLRPVRTLDPWHWLLDHDPLSHGLAWQTWVLPLATAAVLIAAGTAGFARRDLH
ncbi:MAG: ABC transporter permease subunit [Mycobacteriales bacterium]